MGNETAAPQDRDVIVTKETGMALGVVGAVVVTALGAAWWFGQWTATDREWKKATDLRLLGIEASLAVGKRWTYQDALRWSVRLKDRNPTIDVPEPIAPRD